MSQIICIIRDIYINLKVLSTCLVLFLFVVCLSWFCFWFDLICNVLCCLFCLFVLFVLVLSNALFCLWFCFSFIYDNFWRSIIYQNNFHSSLSSHATLILYKVIILIEWINFSVFFILENKRIFNSQINTLRGKIICTYMRLYALPFLKINCIYFFIV